MNNAEPLVSVIINCYNGEKFICKAIDSVINQTYTNWELIFWDNQSTDSTAKIVKNYNDSRIKYYYAPTHSSLGEARNYALQQAKGEYIGFLDVDDKWLPSLLTEFISVFNDNPNTILVYSNYNCKEGEKLWLANKKGKTGNIQIRKFIKNYNVAISAAIFKSKTLKDEKISFNNNFSLIEDYDFFIRLSLFGEVVYLSNPLMEYLYHDNNLSHSYKWPEEFKLLLDLINEGTNSYFRLKDFRQSIEYRASYAITNYYIISGQKYKALSLIRKNIFIRPIFIILLIKLTIGFDNFKKFTKK